MVNKSIAYRFFLACTVASLSACAMHTDSSKNVQNADLLSDYYWDLAAANKQINSNEPNWVPPKTRDGQPLRLRFEDQQLSVVGLCNQLSARYTTAAEKITISPPRSTMMACGDELLTRYEYAVGKLLPRASSWAINNTSSTPSLTLNFNGDTTWTLIGTPTEETRYGSTGETQFIEVAAQKIACSHPLIPAKQCLNVRDIRYDTAGIKTTVGPWHAFYDDIQGYTHETGVRNILRVKRYEQTQVPADASKYAYVLDMVVESAKE